MSDDSSQSVRLQRYLDLAREGDESARHELLGVAAQRVREIASKMLNRFPRVRRWEESDDILQNVVMRLMRTLEQIQPATVCDFLKLASLQTRRELLDMVKHYYGPLGSGKKHDTQDATKSTANPNHEPATDPASSDPSQLAIWTEFHEAVEKLPDEERDVFDLHWYQGLQQDEVANILGISVRTVKRRWQSARLKLYDALQGQLPDGGSAHE